MRALYAVMLALSVLGLGGCSTDPFTEPAPMYLRVTLDYGPPEFRAGYEDGCKTALSVYGNTYMKTIYSLKKRPEYQYNNMYNQVWRDAWNYCYMSYFVFIRKDILYGDMMI
jgi:hypothetical protein